MNWPATAGTTPGPIARIPKRSAPISGGPGRLLEDTGGVAVTGYRAATFSIGARNMWAFPILRQEGYLYSSSINPIRHDLYGMPDAPRVPFRPEARWRDGDPDDHGAPAGPQLAMLRRRLFPPVADDAVPGRTGSGEPARRAAGHLLFPSVGDRSRPAAHPECRLEVAAAALHQPVAHGARISTSCCGTSPGTGWTVSTRSVLADTAGRPDRDVRRRSHPWISASEAAWDRFVEAMPAGTFFHRAGWAKVIETAFGHAPITASPNATAPSPASCRWRGSGRCCSATR